VKRKVGKGRVLIGMIPKDKNFLKFFERQGLEKRNFKMDKGSGQNGKSATITRG